jgi:hypothetical protein
MAVAAAACVASLGLARAGVSRAAAADWLSVRTIVVTGNERISSGEVHALLEGLVGASMLTVDLQASRTKLLTSPWLADVSIRRVFPDSVAVSVSERRPAALGRVDGVLHLVDPRGETIEEYGPGSAGLDLPIVDGLAVGRPGRFTTNRAGADLLARFLADLGRRPDLAALVTQIDVTNPADLVLLLKGDPALLHMGTTGFVDRLQVYLETASRLRESAPDLDSVDLRYVRDEEGNRVFVTERPAAAGGRSSRG